MNLLIVDDDFHVISGIQKNLHWDKIGVKQVFCALGAAAAREVLQKNTIDLMICDIEMPKENGLDFIDWVRTQKITARVIFLTSYAKFEYAQRAIKLGSFEYLLKPVDYGLLESSVLAAAREVKASRKGESGHFWQLILSGQLSSGSGSLEKYMAENGLSYLRKLVFLPAIIQSDQPMADISANLRTLAPRLSERYFGRGEKAVASDSYKNDRIEWEFFERLSDDSGIILLKSSINTLSSPVDARVRLFMEALWENIGKEGAVFFLGVGIWKTVDVVYEELQKICEMLYESPRGANRILYLDSYEPVKLQGRTPDLKAWAALLKNEQIYELKARVREYLELLERNNELSSRQLCQLGMDMTQLIYAYLDSVNIYAHMLFNNEENRQMYTKASLSSGHMLAYIDDLLEKSISYKRKIEQANDLPDIIKNYIDDHFQENITREELSRLVFLNPDYLSRLFKRKMGVSISSYFIQKRIDLAKKLLVTTKIPVSVISSQTGYDNFAYFTKIFKDKVGMSPNEYRKAFEEKR